MRVCQTVGPAVIALLAIVPPAAAQEPAWVRELVVEIETQVEQHVDSLVRVVDAHAMVMAQSSEAQREAEQRRRERQREIEQEQRERQREIQQERRERQREIQQQQRERQREIQQEQRERRRAQDGPEVTEPFSRTLRLGRDGTLDLQNVSGNITVTGGGGSDVRIDAIKRVRHRNDTDAKALLREIEILVEERNGNIEVRTEYPRRRQNWSGSVEYTVAVPRNANVTLRSISGDIRVESVNGELRAETISGNLMARSAQRLRLAKSVSGNVEIADAEGDDVSAQTISGDLVARNLKVRALDLQSVSGNMRFEALSAGRASARSVSGNIEYRGPLARAGRYELQSHSGDIRVVPGSTDGFTLEASTFSGDLRSDYPLTLQGNITSNSFGPRRLNRAIRGSFGNGSATLSLQSFSGNLTIVKQ